MNNNIISLAPRLTVVGNVKIGKKGAFKTSTKGNQFQQPEMLDHFLVTTTERGEDNNFIIDKELMSILSPEDKQLREIPIRLAYNALEANFRSRLCRYSGKTAECFGDGVIAMERQMVMENGRMVPQKVEIACSCGKEKPDYIGMDRCKMNGVFTFIIDGANEFGGVWRFSTTSYNSTIGILSSLSILSAATFGNLANIPLFLRLIRKTVDTPGGQTVISIVSVVARISAQNLLAEVERTAQLRLQYASSFRQMEHQALKLIEGPLLEEDDVIEYYPEMQDGYKSEERLVIRGETPAQRIADAVAAKQSTIEPVTPPVIAVAAGPIFAAGDDVRVTSTSGKTVNCQILEIFDDGFQLLLPDDTSKRMPKSAIVEMVKL